MNKGFCYQENTHFSQAVQCSREKFWESVRNTSNQWKIDSRREILEAVERHDSETINKWLKNEDYGKFIAKKRGLKKLAARQKFFEKSDEERLLAFAQELKDNLTAFIFSCYEFDETPTANGNPFRHRRLADCHLNGLVMLDIDHVENPLEVWEKLKLDAELMAITKLVHITSSKRGVRIVFAGTKQVGNLADNQIMFAEALGYKADSSCIDATRNSFTPKEEDILFIDETIFDYYDEEFDKRFTPEYREKRTKAKASPSPSKGGDVKSPESATSSKQTSPPSEGLGEAQWRGYDVQSIIDARYGDKLPCAADSNRHNESLKLASDLLVLFDGDKQKTLQVLKAQKWVQEIIDERDENVAQTVESAASCIAQREKKYGASLPSKAMQQAVAKALGKTYQEITDPPPTPPLQGRGMPADKED